MQELGEEQRIGWEGFEEEQQVLLSVRDNRGKIKTMWNGCNAMSSFIVFVVGIDVAGVPDCWWYLLMVVDKEADKVVDKEVDKVVDKVVKELEGECAWLER